MSEEQEEPSRVPIPEFCPNCGLREAPRIPRTFVCGSVHSTRQIGALSYVSEACDALKNRNEQIRKLTDELERKSLVCDSILRGR